jgi:MoaA/NifB/PqqE/SkfB family radical SAM enzyme
MLINLSRRFRDAINWRLRTINGGRWAAHCRPTSVVIVLTMRCTAHCVHCDIWKRRGREEGLASLDDWKRLLSDVRNWLGRAHVVITGGEALLNPHATKLLAHGSSLGLCMEMLTHGYWRDQTRIEEAARARPWRLTMSMDGAGQAHSVVRGREDFWEKSSRSLATLIRLRKEERLGYAIRLKTVIMQHNLDDVCNVARFAAENGVEVLYQPIEQNYDTTEDLDWFNHSANWPRDPNKAVAVVEQLIDLKRQGLPICNSFAELEMMVPYFRDPEAHQLAIQLHSGHEGQPLCCAMTTMQLEPNGDVGTCFRMPPVGNIKSAPIREIWKNRPRWWEGGCCRMQPAASGAPAQQVDEQTPAGEQAVAVP